MSERTTGFLATVSCFLLWGALPIYWKLLEGVGAYEILAHRIIWSFFVMIPVLIVLRKIDLFKSTVRELIHNKKKRTSPDCVLPSDLCELVYFHLGSDE